MSRGNLVIGSRVVLVNAKDMEEYGLVEGMEGQATNVITVPPDTYVGFMPDGVEKIFMMNSDRFEVVEEDQ